MTNSIDNTLQAGIRAFAERFDAQLGAWVASSGRAPATLEEAMRYALLAPGKRLRPFLVTECCALVGGPAGDAFAPAAALEMVHAFSLVHDDLPAMDDDDLRRGRSTCHKVYGEATAILAGDALLALAFETLATQVGDARVSSSLVAELAQAAGWCGMIGGQEADLAGEKVAPELDRVRYIHERKTGALFRAACRMGVLAGGGDDTALKALGDYGCHLGLAFQIADDLLDLSADPAEMGKKTGKDSQRGKQTYPACVGTAESERYAAQAIETAIAAVAPFGPPADRLRELARFTIARRR